MRNIIQDNKIHFIVVKVKGQSLSSFVRLLYKFNFLVPSIKYLNNEELEITIKQSDYKIIKKEFIDLKFKVISDKGIYKLKPFLKNNLNILLAIVFGIMLLYFLTNIIVDVNIIHSKKEIRELDDYGVKRLSFKKSYKKLEQIKKTIIDKYPDRLEWIEIEKNGMSYTIRVEERIITKEEKEAQACNVVALKDGIITKIIAHKGETLKLADNFVKAGDIIISGNVKLNEEIKNVVCAKGDVYAEVWYSVDVVVPLEYENKTFTGKKSKNIMYESTKNKKSIFRSKFKNYTKKEKELFSLFGVNYYIQTEYEYKSEKLKYTNEEAINKGMSLAKEKMELKLKEKEYIISQKVLKKSLNDSKMNMEIFFAVNEKISKQEEFEIIPQEDKN